MIQTLINYGIFFIIIFVIAGIAALVKRSDILSSIFKSVGKGLFILLQLAMFGVFTIIISMLVGMMIAVHPYVFGSPQFLAGGDGVHLLATNDLALLQFSLTYGLLYMGFVFIFMRILAKNQMTWSIVDFIREVRLRLPRRRRLKNLESRLFVTVCQLMTVVTLLILYPVVINLLFSTLEVKFPGNLFIFGVLFVLSVIPTPTNRANNRQDKPLYRPKAFKTRF